MLRAPVVGMSPARKHGILCVVLVLCVRTIGGGAYWRNGERGDPGILGSGERRATGRQCPPEKDAGTGRGPLFIQTGPTRPRSPFPGAHLRGAYVANTTCRGDLRSPRRRASRRQPLRVIRPIHDSGSSRQIWPEPGAQRTRFADELSQFVARAVPGKRADELDQLGQQLPHHR